MRRKRSGRGFAARLFSRGPETVETCLGRALGLAGRKLRCEATRSAEPAQGCAVLAAWTDSATEPRARAFLGDKAEASAAQAALRTLCLPSECRIAWEAPIGDSDPRLEGVDLQFYIVTRAASAWRRSGSEGEGKPIPAQPIFAVRGHVQGSSERASDADSIASPEAPQRLFIEDPAAPGALACILPHEFSVARGVDARILPRFLRVPGPTSGHDPGTWFQCSLPLGSGRLVWSLGFPALPPADPASQAAAARFGMLAKAQTEKTASFLSSLGLPAGEARIEILGERDSEQSPALLVEAELRIGVRDLPLILVLGSTALEILARIAGLKPVSRSETAAAVDGEATQAEASLLRFLEANRLLRARLAPLARKTFAAQAGLGLLLPLLDSGDRSRLISRLVASRRPAEVIPALHARDANSGALLPRGLFRDRDLLASAPELWAEDYRLALGSRVSAGIEKEAGAAQNDRELLDFLDRELRAGRLELSARGRSFFEPIREQRRTAGEAALLELASKDGLWKLMAGAGRRLGASALAALGDRTLAMASVTETERRAELAPLMSSGRLRAFGEEAAWVDARYASGELDPGACVEARRLALDHFQTRLESLRRTEAEERLREPSESGARSKPGPASRARAPSSPRPARS